MATKHTFSILFWLKKAEAVDNVAPIYARITVDGVRAETSIQRSIHINSWDNNKKKAKGTKEEARALNTYLDECHAKFLECQKEIIAERKLLTAAGIRNKFQGTEEKEHTLLKIIKDHNKNQKGKLKRGTLKNYDTTEKYVAEFLKQSLKISDIYLSQLNYKFITDFEQFLKDRKPVDHHKKCEQNTVMKHIERLRKIVNLAVKHEWLDKDPFVKFEPEYTRYNRGYLTDEELLSIECKKFSIPRLQYVKDLFVFSCYTGLHYIDLMQLVPDQIARGIDGEFWLFTSREKTETSVKVPLLPTPLHIIEKYKDDPRALHKGTLFPTISNQKLNGYLKEVADLCGITKNLTFSLARHTFATTVTLTNDVPIETVSKMLGHTKISTTQIYARIVDKKVSKDMQMLRNKLFNNNEGSAHLAAG